MRDWIRHSIHVLLVLMCAGCAEEVAAPTGTGSPFSMFGILDPFRPEQSIAVSPIESLLRDYSDSLDAVVTSTALATGETTRWKDSILTTELGLTEHVFLADVQPDFGASYRVDVTRSDGAHTSAIARVPELVKVESSDKGAQTMTASILGEGFHLLSIEAVYTVRYYGKPAPNPCSFTPYAYAISYTGEEDAIAGGYEVKINVARDHDTVMRLYSGDETISWSPGNNGFALMRLQLRLLVGEKAWDPPGGRFDRNTLAQPGTMSNVENGFGFVGGGYDLDAGLFPSPEVIDATWFFDFLTRSGTDTSC